jgi:hypothetical protein
METLTSTPTSADPVAPQTPTPARVPLVETPIQPTDTPSLGAPHQAVENITATPNQEPEIHSARPSRATQPETKTSTDDHIKVIPTSSKVTTPTGETGADPLQPLVWTTWKEGGVIRRRLWDVQLLHDPIIKPIHIAPSPAKPRKRPSKLKMLGSPN